MIANLDETAAALALMRLAERPRPKIKWDRMERHDGQVLFFRGTCLVMGMPEADFDALKNEVSP